MQIVRESQILNDIEEDLDSNNSTENNEEEIYQISLDVLIDEDSQGSIYLNPLLKFYQNQNMTNEDYVELIISMEFLGIDRVEEVIILSSFEEFNSMERFIEEFKQYTVKKEEKENEDNYLFGRLYNIDRIRIFLTKFKKLEKLETIEETAAYYN